VSASNRLHIGRKIADDAALREIFAVPLSLARRVREQRQRQRGHKVYSLHAPEVECIGKGKAHRPYEFGVKVSVATPLRRCRGGQFVAHVAALPGNPYDGHTLAKVIPAITEQIGVSLTRVIADAGYRGHNAPRSPGLRVYTAGQKRGVTEQIKRELRRRSAVEPVIGHLKDDHRMGRNHLAGRHGDAINAIMAAVGYNFRRILAWIAALLCALSALLNTTSETSVLQHNTT
jgi:IS5 family transposase